MKTQIAGEADRNFSRMFEVIPGPRALKRDCRIAREALFGLSDFEYRHPGIHLYMVSEKVWIYRIVCLESRFKPY